MRVIRIWLGYYARVIRIIPENYLPILLHAMYADITLGVADISHEFRWFAPKSCIGKTRWYLFVRSDI